MGPDGGTSQVTAALVNSSPARVSRERAEEQEDEVAAEEEDSSATSRRQAGRQARD